MTDIRDLNAGYVLVVDDNSGIRRFLSEWLSENGYRVDLAVNGKECVEKILADPPSLIILDIKMPVMGGIETLKELGQYSIDTPVIVMSAYTELQDILDARHSGTITHYVQKPFDLKELNILIKKTLKIP